MTLLSSLRDALAPSGLNLVQVASVAAYDAEVKPPRQSQALLAGSRSIIVVGSGGPALWHAFVADLERTPDHLALERHPLDAFVQRQIAQADAALPDVSRRWFFAAWDAPLHLDFRLLGYLAGLGASSRLKLLMHPRHGPWLGLRAACFVAADLPADVPGGPDLCDGCPAPCISACPGNAFPGGHWEVDRCTAYHRESERCSARCDARLACPRGAESRYPLEELHYHSNSHTGRPWLRARAGITEAEDRHQGARPLWTLWRSTMNAGS